MPEKTIMILGAGILQLPAIKKALEMGLRVIAVDMNPDAVGMKVNGVTAEAISTIDTPAVMKCAKAHRIDGIMTLASDMPMQTVAAVSEALGLVGVSRKTALLATNKAFMRDALRAGGVPIPLYFRVQEKADFLQAVEAVWEHGYQCIVKPADNSGSRGVHLISKDSRLDEVFAYSKSFSRGGELVVEEYMNGPEVSVETLAYQGNVHVIQITDKITTGKPYFVEMGHTQPSRLDPAVQEQIRAVAIAANQALGIENGPSHTEIKITKNGPKIVELGARLGGDCITTHLVPLSTGVDLVACVIKIAMGDAPQVTKTQHYGSAIRYFETRAGIMKAIHGLEEAQRMPGVQEVCMVHGPQEALNAVQSSNDRAGFVIAQGQNADEAAMRCDAALNQIRIEYMEED